MEAAPSFFSVSEKPLSHLTLEQCRRFTGGLLSQSARSVVTGTCVSSVSSQLPGDPVSVLGTLGFLVPIKSLPAQKMQSNTLMMSKPFML